MLLPGGRGGCLPFFFFQIKRGFQGERIQIALKRPLGHKNVKKQEEWGPGSKGRIEAPEYFLRHLFNLCDTGDRVVMPGLCPPHITTERRQSSNVKLQDVPDSTAMLMLSHLELLNLGLSIFCLHTCGGTVSEKMERLFLSHSMHLNVRNRNSFCTSF